MQKDLNLFLLFVQLIARVLSTSDAGNEMLQEAQDIGGPCSEAEKCYHNMKPLLQFASDCESKSKDLNLIISHKNNEVNDLLKQVEYLKKNTTNLQIKHSLLEYQLIFNEGSIQIQNKLVEEDFKKIQNLTMVKKLLDIELKNVKEQLTKSTEELQSSQSQLKYNSKTIQNLTKVNEILKRDSAMELKILKEQLTKSTKELQCTQSQLNENSKTIQNLTKVNEIIKRESAMELKILKEQLTKSTEELNENLKTIKNLTKVNEIIKRDSAMELKILKDKLTKSTGELQSSQSQLNENSKTILNLTTMNGIQKTKFEKDLNNLEQQLVKSKKEIVEKTNHFNTIMMKTKEQEREIGKEIQQQYETKHNTIILHLKECQTRVEIYDIQLKSNQSNATKINDLLLKCERRLNECTSNLGNTETQLKDAIQRTNTARDSTKNSISDLIKHEETIIQQKTKEIEEVRTNCYRSFNSLRIQEKEKCQNEIQHIKTELNNVLIRHIEDKNLEIHNWRTLSEEKTIELNNYQSQIKNLKDELWKSNQTNAKQQVDLKDDKADLLQENHDLYTELESLKEQLDTNGIKIKSQQQITQCPPFQNSNGIYLLSLPGVNSFKVSCACGWIVIQRRISHEVNFNRTMREYRRGFGQFNDSFFIGLEKLHTLTRNQTYELQIELEDFDGLKSYAHYDNFVVASREEDYRLKAIGNYKGTAGDALSSDVNMPFSTYDNDKSSWRDSHCAQLFGAGWWFNSCGESSLNGKYCGKQINCVGIVWSTWNQPNRSIFSPMLVKSTQMKIRPKENLPTYWYPHNL